MNQRGQLLWMAAAVALLPVAAGAADPGQTLAAVYDQAVDSLAVLKYEVSGAGDATGSVSGTAICLDGKGTFLTLHMSPRLQPDRIKAGSLMLTTSGVDAREVPARLLGIDPVTGLGFVQTESKQAARWKPVRLANLSLQVGQPVVAVGLSNDDPARPAVAGMGYVAGTLRLPQRLVRVTGGTLAPVGSPVFSPDGKVIGLVMEQLAERSQMLTGRGQQATVRLRDREDTSYFTPIGEVAHVLSNIPVQGTVRRPPWIGVADYDAATETRRSLQDISGPAVAVGKVIPETPAAREGIAGGDLIVSLNGKPLEKLATPQLTMQNFVRQMRQFEPGKTITLGLVGSDGKKRDVPVTVEKMPQRPDEAPRLPIPPLGFEVREKVKMDRYLLEGPTAGLPGLLVTRVAPRSAAAQAFPRLRQGHLIVEANGRKMRTIDDLRSVIEKAVEDGKALDLKAQRGNDVDTIHIPIPQ